MFGTAEQLLKDYGEAEKKKLALPWSHPAKSVSFVSLCQDNLTCRCRINHSFHDKRLSGGSVRTYSIFA